MPRPKTVASDYRRLTLRIPADVLEVLQQQATAMARAINTQAILALRYGMGMDDVHPLAGGTPIPYKPKKRAKRAP